MAVFNERVDLPVSTSTPSTGTACRDVCTHHRARRLSHAGPALAADPALSYRPGFPASAVLRALLQLAARPHILGASMHAEGMKLQPNYAGPRSGESPPIRCPGPDETPGKRLTNCVESRAS